MAKLSNTDVERRRSRVPWAGLPEAGLIAALVAYVGALLVFFVYTIVTWTPPAGAADFATLSDALTVVNALFAVLILVRLVGLARARRITKRTSAAILCAALVLVVLLQILAFSLADAMAQWSL